jgi:hypothetical protein
MIKCIIKYWNKINIRYYKFQAPFTREKRNIGTVLIFERLRLTHSHVSHETSYGDQQYRPTSMLTQQHVEDKLRAHLCVKQIKPDEFEVLNEFGYGCQFLVWMWALCKSLFYKRKHQTVFLYAYTTGIVNWVSKSASPNRRYRTIPFLKHNHFEVY